MACLSPTPRARTEREREREGESEQEGGEGREAWEEKKKWVIEVDSKVVLVAKSSLDTRFQLKVELFQVGAV